MSSSLKLPGTKSPARIRQDRIDLVRTQAELEFRNFRLECKDSTKLSGHWRLRSDSGSRDDWDIITSLDILLITSNMGTVVIQENNDMLTWLKKMIRSGDYFYLESKVLKDVKTQEYDPELVKAWLYGVLKNDEQEPCLARLVREYLTDMYLDIKWDYLDELKTVQHLRDSGILEGVKYSEFKNYTFGFLWCCQALTCFVNLLEHTGKTKSNLYRKPK